MKKQRERKLVRCKGGPFNGKRKMLFRGGNTLTALTTMRYGYALYDEAGYYIRMEPRP